MRNHLKAALEGHQDNSPNYNVYSPEEEQQLLTEATQDSAQVDADLGEIARMNDMSEAVEDLAVIADGIEEPTATETQLLDSVGQMAVTGTDVAPEEVVPSMEQYVGRRISTEGLRETARNIWNQIQRVLKKVWETIESFFYKVFGTIPGLRRSLKKLKDDIDGNSSRALDSKKISISVGVQALSVNYSTPKSEGDLKGAMKDMTEQVEVIYGKHADAIEGMGEAIAEGLSDFDAETPQKSLGSFVGKLSKYTDKIDLPGMSGASGRWPGFDAKMTKPLPGNISIVSRVPKDIDARSSDVNIQKLEALRKVTVEVVQTSEKAKDVPNSFEMPPLSNNAMLNLLDDAEKLLDTLEKYQRGKRYADMKKVRTKLEAASKKATTSIEKLDSSEDKATKDAVPFYRAMVNFNTAYAKWAKDPAMPMVTHTLSFVRGIMTVCQKSLSAYK